MRSLLESPLARLYFNQARPSAYLRGHTRAVPLALAYMRTLERRGARVLNGADVFALELSKSAQATMLVTLGIDCPRSITFNEVAALRPYEDEITWPALLKPDQGGSGARIQVVESFFKSFLTLTERLRQLRQLAAAKQQKDHRDHQDDDHRTSQYF